MTESPNVRPTESVWDFPRPPRVERSDKHVRVIVGGVTIADSRRAVRALETCHPPGWSLPPEEVRIDLLRPTSRQTACEYKGEANHFSISKGGEERRDVVWVYQRPLPGYELIAGYVAVYPGRVDEAWVDDERVIPQVREFYGGWITSDVTRPQPSGPRLARPYGDRPYQGGMGCRIGWVQIHS
jgi:uncharacterized protein (DUF427 family)